MEKISNDFYIELFNYLDKLIKDMEAAGNKNKVELCFYSHDNEKLITYKFNKATFIEVIKFSKTGILKYLSNQ